MLLDNISGSGNNDLPLDPIYGRTYDRIPGSESPFLSDSNVKLKNVEAENRSMNKQMWPPNYTPSNYTPSNYTPSNYSFVQNSDACNSIRRTFEDFQSLDDQSFSSSDMSSNVQSPINQSLFGHPMHSPRALFPSQAGLPLQRSRSDSTVEVPQVHVILFPLSYALLLLLFNLQFSHQVALTNMMLEGFREITQELRAIRSDLGEKKSRRKSRQFSRQSVSLICQFLCCGHVVWLQVDLWYVHTGHA